MKRIALAALALAAAIAATAPPAPRPARADDAAEARFFDELGRRAYARGRYDEALAHFLDAQAAAPNPRTLYNVALTAQLARHEALAYSSFESYLERGDPSSERVADARSRMDALARRLALVRVTSSPPGAEIFVDRRELGSFGRTPRTLVLEPGAHAIELVLADHEPARVEVEAARGAAATGDATLAPHLGAVRIDVTPGAAAVSLTSDRGTIALEPGRERSDVPVGTWIVRASAEGYDDGELEIRVSRDRSEVRALALDRATVASGRLLVATGLVHARVRIDGVDRAETPARIEGLAAGPHRVELEAEGFVPWGGTVEIAEGRAASLSVTLVPGR
jgi:hypothetical protein